MKLGNHTKEAFQTSHNIWNKLIERHKNERIALTLWRRINDTVAYKISTELRPYKIRRV